MNEHFQFLTSPPIPLYLCTVLTYNETKMASALFWWTWIVQLPVYKEKNDHVYLFMLNFYILFVALAICKIHCMLKSMNIVISTTNVNELTNPFQFEFSHRKEKCNFLTCVTRKFERKCGISGTG